MKYKKNKNNKTRKLKKLKKRTTQIKKKGGSIEPDEIFKNILSIGYEFESGNFIPIKESTVTNEMKEQLYNKINDPKIDYSLIYDLPSQREEYIIENVENQFNFILSNDMAGTVQSFFDISFSSPLYITQNNKNILLKYVDSSNNNIYLYEPADLEFIVTFYNIDNYSRTNVIQETFKHAIKKIYNYLLNPINTSVVEIKQLGQNTTQLRKEIKQPKKLLHYGNGCDLLMAEPYNSVNIPIEYARFMPQMTFGVNLNNCYDVIMYLLNNNLEEINDPNNIVDKNTLDHTIAWFRESRDKAIHIKNIIKEIVFENKSLSTQYFDFGSNRYEYLSNIIMFALYNQNVISYLMSIDKENRRQYYKSYLLINLRHGFPNLIKKLLGDKFQQTLINLINPSSTLVKTLVKSPNYKSFVKICKSNKLLEHIFKGHKLSDYIGDAIYSRTYNVPLNGNVLIEFRGFFISLNKTMKKYVDPKKLHNQILNYELSLEILKEYADSVDSITNINTTSRPTMLTRKRKLDI